MIIKHPFLAAILVSSSLALTACVSNNTKEPYTTYKQADRTTKGSAIGAATGVAAGAATAGVGAVVGGVIGYEWDKKEVALHNELRAAGIKVIDPDDGKNDIWLVMPSNIQFKPGKADLNPEFKSRLNAVAKVMKQYKFAVAEVPGHADSLGRSAYNKKLSAKRAQAVVNYLISQGVERNRLTAVVLGESTPMVNNKTVKSRALNRRVEIVLHQPPRV